MTNDEIADSFLLLSKLMDIHGEDSFKSKTYSVAAFNIEQLTLPIADTPHEKIFSIRGIGKSVGEKIITLLETGQLPLLEEYLSTTPTGIVEMLNIKGIGPKKIHTIWKEMDIESLGELLYACHENRLTLYKGFGEKTQKTIQENIEFYFSNQGHFLYASIDAIYPQIKTYLENLFGAANIKPTGDFRRQATTIEELEFVVNAENATIKPKFETAQPPELLEENEDNLLYKLKNGLQLRLYTGTENIFLQQFITTGSSEFITAFSEKFPAALQSNPESEAAIFANAGIALIPPFLREDKKIIELAEQNKLPTVIQPEDVKALIHCHSQWSDGINTIEEMAEACKLRGFEYMVLSDHSQSAFYAKGLKEDRILAQHQQIDALNLQFQQEAKKNKQPFFKIFKSIESDILNDGQLDYPKEILQTFDLIIASIHSNLKMTEEKTMQRLLTAIENPYTIILGHMTGRLLLSRNGYPVDHKKIIDACAANHVVIEINAHPRRLDIDWRWIAYAREKKVLLSINPDAHALAGLDDIKYGTLAAQKGGLTKNENLSSFALPAFEKWLANVRQLKGI
ncbi:MAG: DNA polymerase/3'-5' exonuclease PolX [Chitinophagaceae bacterium]|nr:DNA polymerase/3'-5' exonuclease PolX [Chitinophagaceae bacterium]